MDRPQIPLNALRAFEAAARHLNLTRAAIELCVTQAALSHHIRALEERLGVTLFRRVPRGLMLTAEGAALLPVLTDSFDRMSDVLDRFADGRFHETLNVGVVATFATGWLVPRLPMFTAQHPTIDLRVFTNNNRVDIAGEGLDLAIRFGDGSWRATEAIPLLSAHLSPLCDPSRAKRLRGPSDLQGEPLLRSYRAFEWERWFSEQGLECPTLRGPVFDSSLAIAEMAARGCGVGLLPARLFSEHIEQGRLVQPFAAGIETGHYWLTRLHSSPDTAGQRAFQAWLQSTLAAEEGSGCSQHKGGRKLSPMETGEDPQAT